MFQHLLVLRQGFLCLSYRKKIFVTPQKKPVNKVL